MNHLQVCSLWTEQTRTPSATASHHMHSFCYSLSPGGALAAKRHFPHQHSCPVVSLSSRERRWRIQVEFEHGDNQLCPFLRSPDLLMPPLLLLPIFLSSLPFLFLLPPWLLRKGRAMLIPKGILLPVMHFRVRVRWGPCGRWCFLCVFSFCLLLMGPRLTCRGKPFLNPRLGSTSPLFSAPPVHHAPANSGWPASLLFSCSFPRCSTLGRCCWSCLLIIHLTLYLREAPEVVAKASDNARVKAISTAFASCHTKSPQGPDLPHGAHQHVSGQKPGTLSTPLLTQLTA